MDVLIVLGGENGASGQLSQMVLDRVKMALTTWKSNQKIICTGGFGAHFNTTNTPHWYYLKKELIAQGIPSTAFTDATIESKNTLDDGRLCANYLQNHSIRSIQLITSDFHMERAHCIFKQHFEPSLLTPTPAASSLPPSELQKRKKHEEQALENLKRKPITPP